MELWIWGRELRHAARRLRRRPGFTAIVVVTLALGVGASTAVFSVLHSVLMAPLPYEDADQLVRIYGSRLDRPGEFDRLNLPAPATTELRERVRGLDAVAVLENSSPRGADLTGGDRPERLRILPVGSGYFRTMGVSPIAGRTFERTEEVPGANVVVVREDIWRRHLGGRPEAMGESLTLDGRAVVVVGVVSDQVRDPVEGRIDVWSPSDLRGEKAEFWNDNYLSVFARMAPGTDLDGLQTELDALAARHGEVSPDAVENGFVVVPLREDLVGGAEPLLVAVMGAVLFVLLLTAVNVASLLVARAADREQEIVIRAALGSSRGGLLRHFMAEYVILTLLGGLAGLAVGIGSLDLILTVAPAELPRRETISMGLQAVLFGAGSSVAIGVLLGLVTAMTVATSQPRGLAVDAARGRGGSAKRGRLRSSLVAVEVALAVTLLTGSGLMLRTVHEIQTRDLGVDPSGVLTFEIGLPASRYASDAEIHAFHVAFHERIAAIPGVRSVAATSRLPATGSYNTWGTRPAEVGDAPVENVQVNQRWVDGAFFETTGLALRSGRLFGAADEADVPYVTVVNETFVRRVLDGDQPLGVSVVLGGRTTTIVGVVEDEALGARSLPAPVAYHHQRQWLSGNRQATQMVRLSVDPAGVLPALRGALAEVDPALVLFEPRMLSDVIGAGVAQERFAAVLLAAFAVLAVVVATLGLYGVLAHLVGRRRHEIGVRLALGARRATVVAMVLRGAFLMAGAGALGGIALSLVLGRGLEAFLFEVSPQDPMVLAGATVLLLLVAVLASAVPALQATRIDPVRAFRAD